MKCWLTNGVITKWPFSATVLVRCTNSWIKLVKVFALSIRGFLFGQKQGQAALHIKCGGQTDPRIKQRDWPGPHITKRGCTGPHTGHIEAYSSFGTESSDRQHTAEQTYIASGSLSAPSLHGRSPFLTFYCGQSPYATIAWRIPLDLNTVLLQHGQSRPATKHNILCCSASISCALIHLNTTSIQLQQNLNMAQNISFQPQCFSMQLQSLRLNMAQYISMQPHHI